jgi:hypothetical protein
VISVIQEVLVRTGVPAAVRTVINLSWDLNQRKLLRSYGKSGAPGSLHGKTNTLKIERLSSSERFVIARRQAVTSQKALTLIFMEFFLKDLQSFTDSFNTLTFTKTERS